MLSDGREGPSVALSFSMIFWPWRDGKGRSRPDIYHQYELHFIKYRRYGRFGKFRRSFEISGQKTANLGLNSYPRSRQMQGEVSPPTKLIPLSDIHHDPMKMRTGCNDSNCFNQNCQTGNHLSSVHSLKRIASRIDELCHELDELVMYPEDEFREIIKEVGFSCTLCGRCCTRAFNDHVFLLSDDLEKARKINPEAIIPAPYFELCDQNGNFYVSGYSLKFKSNGECVFLKDNRCTIYEDRFRICRIYPYMLHREPGRDGKTDWRQISGLNEHGEYGVEISDPECDKIIRETIDYEKDFLKNEIDFYRCCLEYFSERNLRPVRKMYDLKMREFDKGISVLL